jgi:hypothetical protein
MNDTEFERGIADLMVKQQSLGDKQLDDEAALARAKAIQSDKSVADIEKALIKSTGQGATAGRPALLQQFDEWLKTNPGKSYADFLRFKQEIAERRPADLQAFDEARKENPALTWEQFHEQKAGATARGRERGKSQGEAQQALPGQEMSFDVMAATIDKLEKHPGADKTFGLPNALLPNVPGGDAADFEALRQQLTGQAFLLQFDKLRGAGQITEAEGKKATDALTTLATTQSKKQFLENLTYLKDLVGRARTVAKTKAGAADKPPMEGAVKLPDGRWGIKKDDKWFAIE